MFRFFTHWLVVVCALGLAAWLLPGVGFDSPVALIMGGLVLALVNALVRPVLVILTLPLSIVTLGLFYFVINGVAFGIAAWIVPGFSVGTLMTAILAALLVSLVSWLAGLPSGDLLRSEAASAGEPPRG